MSKEGMYMKEITQETINDAIKKSYKVLIVITHLTGTNIFTVKNGNLVYSPIYIAYSLILLVMFLMELGYIVIWTEIVMNPIYSIVNLTSVFHLFSECVVSIVAIIHSLLYTKEGTEIYAAYVKADYIICKLGLDIKYEESKKMTYKIIVMVYVVLQAIFIADYFLLFDDKTTTPFSQTSWIATSFHVVFNSAILTHTIVGLFLGKYRFQLLNNAMRNLNNIDVRNILKEIPISQQQHKKKIEVISIRNRVGMIKQGHDMLYRILSKGRRSPNLLSLLQIGSYMILMTSYLYTVIGMVIDEQYDYNLMVHCLYWSLYKAIVLIIMVLGNASVCNECNHMAIVIHDLMNRGEVGEVYIQLKNFSLQRLHQKLKIMACGLFPIDFTLLYEITGAITTHLVILVQFKMLGYTSNPQHNKTQSA